MRPIILALVLVFLPRPALAQEVPAGAVMDLWCGTAFALLAADTPTDAGDDKLALAKTYADGAEMLTKRALPLYLESGYTDRALAALRADLEKSIASVVRGPARQNESPPYSFEDCSVLIGQ
jgi:hypothetical protein